MDREEYLSLKKNILNAEISTFVVCIDWPLSLAPEKKNLSTDLPSRKSWHKSLRSVFENVIGNITSQGTIDLLKKWNIF